MSVKDFADNYLSKSIPDALKQDYYDLQPQIDKDNKISEVRNYIHLYKLFFYSTIIMSILMILILFFIFKDSLVSFLKTIGSSIFLVGLSNFLSAKVVSNQLPKFIDNININDIPNATTLVKSVITDVIQSITGRLELVGIIMIIIGAILFGASFILKKKDK